MALRPKPPGLRQPPPTRPLAGPPVSGSFSIQAARDAEPPASLPFVALTASWHSVAERVQPRWAPTLSLVQLAEDEALPFAAAHLLQGIDSWEGKSEPCSLRKHLSFMDTICESWIQELQIHLLPPCPDGSILFKSKARHAFGMHSEELGAIRSPDPEEEVLCLLLNTSLAPIQTF